MTNVREENPRVIIHRIEVIETRMNGLLAVAALSGEDGEKSNNNLLKVERLEGLRGHLELRLKQKRGVVKKP